MLQSGGDNPGPEGWFNTLRLIDATHPIHQTEYENHTILSIEAEKIFDKIQHPFVIETLRKIGIKGKDLNITKAVDDKPSASTTVKGGKTNALPPK